MNAPVRWRWVGCLILLLLVLPSNASGDYRTADVELLRITIDSDWPTRVAPGYVPVRVDVTNLGDARVIEIVAEGMRFDRRMRTGGPSQVRIRQTLRLARSDRVRLTIPVPVSAEYEQFQIRVLQDDRILERFSYQNFQGGTPAVSASALIVADAATVFGKMASSLPRPGSATTSLGTVGGTVTGTVTGTATGVVLPSRSPSTRSMPPSDLVLEPARLPANWLGYTSLRAVVIGTDEWAALEDAQKGALLTWTACGGDLIVAGGAADALTGGGHRTEQVAPDGAGRAYFFGRIHRRTLASLTATGLASLLSDTAKVQDADWALPANRWSQWNVITARGFRLPIPGVAHVPVRAYLGILLVFSFLVGPVNYFLLSRKRRQVLFVLTAPLISAAFILVLAGYVIAGEGLRVNARAETFTILDQGRRQAATRATGSLYAAGMTPGGGLHFARDVATYGIGPDGGAVRETQDLDLTDTQRFVSGLIRARAPTNLEQIAFRAARERLTITSESGGMNVMNGFGGTIRTLVVRRGGSAYVLAGPLPSGGTAPLKAGAPAGATLVPGDLPRSSRFVHLVDNLPEGSYFAILERSPFWDPGVSGTVEHASFHVVLGWMDGQS